MTKMTQWGYFVCLAAIFSAAPAFAEIKMHFNKSIIIGDIEDPKTPNCFQAGKFVVTANPNTWSCCLGLDEDGTFQLKAGSDVVISDIGKNPEEAMDSPKEVMLSVSSVDDLDSFNCDPGKQGPQRLTLPILKSIFGNYVTFSKNPSDIKELVNALAKANHAPAGSIGSEASQQTSAKKSTAAGGETNAAAASTGSEAR